MTTKADQKAHNNNAVSRFCRLRQFRRLCEAGSLTARALQAETGLPLASVRAFVVRYVASGQLRRDNPGKNPGLYSTPPDAPAEKPRPRLGIVQAAVRYQPNSVFALGARA